ncbi:MAG: hypothetical protein IKO06_06365 [Alphaproteobacteria bacterium]|nr:hypothetical protein [Alphaproteobacteria bacterium]
MKFKTAAIIGLTSVATIFGGKKMHAQEVTDTKPDITTTVTNNQNTLLQSQSVDSIDGISGADSLSTVKLDLESYGIDTSKLSVRSKTWAKIDSVKQAIIDYYDALTSFRRTDSLKLNDEDILYLRMIMGKMDLHIGSFHNFGRENNLQYNARDLIGIKTGEFSRQIADECKQYMKPRNAPGGECLKFVKHVLAINGEISESFLKFASAYQTINYFNNCDNFSMRKTVWADTNKYPKGSIGVCQRGPGAVDAHIWIADEQDSTQIATVKHDGNVLQFLPTIQLSDIKYGYNSDGHRGRRGHYGDPFVVLRNDDTVSMYTAWRELMNSEVQDIPNKALTIAESKDKVNVADFSFKNLFHILLKQKEQLFAKFNHIDGEVQWTTKHESVNWLKQSPYKKLSKRTSSRKRNIKRPTNILRSRGGRTL